MTQNEFIEMCRAAGYELQLADPEAFAKQGYTVIDEIDIGIVLDSDAGRIICCIALGTIEAERRTEIYEEMLALNAEIEDIRDGSFGVDIDSGTALLNAEIPLESIGSALMLADALREYAAYANEVRQILLEPARLADQALQGLKLA